MYYGYGIDWTYIVFIIPAMLISIWAQFKVSSAYSKYSKVLNARGLTGAQASEYILRTYGVTGVRIEHIAGNLTDHYDPTDNVIRLSDGVYNATSVAAVGVAAHETGHALQYAFGYAPIKLRAAIIPATRIGSYASWPLLLIGMIFSSQSLIWAGIALFSLVVLFQLLTLPVEFNASSRALQAIDQWNILSAEEYQGAKKVLTAAALTYVAALLTSLMQLLRLVLIFSNRRN
ncbi:MAG: zinc metallopeptidase [Oscillospiraceae bacterium]|nr:zinc metallopeptidase [Butyricicoccus sp.]MBQ9045975.1 zinc metallopeptidase [Oscillospiraceae bacterium]